ncbi:hypothetical protein QBC35DRAFT_205962 [Podospora australis]|uniref:Cyanovirin-N domain-containing protein n=1 Tax=Podospora australis TaxID=1536484 RepID=A0AAN6WXL7_9PEZI|nr:hypothetical protein QBC35DRAFT_205962 [Podospora australis]
MEFLSHPVIIAALGMFALGWVASGDGGFVHDCAYAGASLTDNHWLGMYCLNDNVTTWGYNYTWLDLDGCIGNNAGQLFVIENGSYSGTCTNCTIAHDTTLNLTCSCWDTTGHHIISTLDLNTTVFDFNGSAGCLSHMGNKTWEPESL